MSKDNKPAPTEPLKHIVDEATGEVVDVTPEMNAWGYAIHNYAEADAVKKAFIWSFFRSQKLYTVFGCGSMKEYGNNVSSIGYSTIQSYLTIGTRLFNAFQIAKNLTVRLEDDPESFFKELEGNSDVKDLAKLGHRTLREICMQGEDKIQQLLTQKQITFDDGTTMSYKEIEEATSREVEQTFREYRKKDTERIANLEEDKKKAKSERDGYKEEAEKLAAEKESLEESLERYSELHNKFSRNSADLQRIYNGIDMTRKYLREANEYFGPLSLDDVEGEVPEALCQEIHEVMQTLTQMQTLGMMRFPFLINMDRQEAVPGWMKPEEDQPEWLKKGADMMMTAEEGDAILARHKEEAKQERKLKSISNGQDQ